MAVKLPYRCKRYHSGNHDMYALTGRHMQCAGCGNTVSLRHPDREEVEYVESDSPQTLKKED